ncbi:MAG: hypothetical protein HQL16_03005 [Candidatus Omnitrophica bacterium]|nr:hypothetical protein [Candidatus Omnitrophota bacterium]
MVLLVLVFTRGTFFLRSVWRRASFSLEGIPSWFFYPAIFSSVVIIGCAFLASLLPPHLSQEFDIINYHITIPRQHLISGSFQYISWSPVDLFLLPVDFALSPYWLATNLPNKLPQFFFCLGVLGLAFCLGKRLSGGEHGAGVLSALAIMGSHNFGIQAGTGMLDIVLCYLFLAAVDSFIAGAWGLAAVEFAFFLWSKPLMPSFMVLACGILLLLFFIINKVKLFKIQWGFGSFLGKHESLRNFQFWGVLFLVSTLIAGPFLLKSYDKSGTPMYPLTRVFFTDRCEKQEFSGMSELEKTSCAWKAMKNDYGEGQDLIAALRHFWMIAVPEKGVNNRFDYPVGLMFLLFLIPFLVFLIEAFTKKIFPIIPVFCVIYWALWWWGAQQSRFLFVPLALIFVTTAAQMKKSSKVLMVCMILALVLTAFSVFRAHKSDFGKSSYDALRTQDKFLVDKAKTAKPGEVVELSYPDAAFAAFAVNVKNIDSPFVIKHP